MKGFKLTLILSLFLLLLTSFFMVSDSPFLAMLKEKLTAYNGTYGQEKVYVQTDKPFYLPGEDIWFNAMVLDALSHEPTTISDVVYVELIDSKGIALKKLTLPIEEGSAYGDFMLEDEAPGGQYTLRAYTQWMRNFEKEVFSKRLTVQQVITPRLLLTLDFEREAYGPGDTARADLKVENLKNEKAGYASIISTLSIQGQKVFQNDIEADDQGMTKIGFILPEDLNTTNVLVNAIVSYNGVQESISRSVPVVLNQISLNFYPEGGESIQGFGHTMAFKAVNEFGKGADVSGVIYDDQQNIITNFSSFHMGMGAFDFQPQAGREYYAQIRQPKGNETMIALPAVKKSGLSFHLKDQKEDMLHWQLFSSGSMQANFVGLTHGELSYTESLELKAGVNDLFIEKEKFPVGTSVFTLFDSAGVPHAERLVFMHADKGLNIELSTDKERYLPAEQVKLKVKTVDHEGEPVRAKLSLAVVDEQILTLADDKQDNLLSAMLLSSELKGEIQEPSFYFDPEEETRHEAMDYLMLTQGWRRFTWKEIIDEVPKDIFYLPEQTKNISGQLYNDKGKTTTGLVTLIEISEPHRVLSVNTDEEGKFLFANIDPRSDYSLFSKASNQIRLDADFSKGTTVPELASFKVESKVDSVIQIRGTASDQEIESDTITGATTISVNLSPDSNSLGEVVVTGVGAYSRQDIAGSVTKIGDGVSFTTESNLGNALRGKAAGVKVTHSNSVSGTGATITLRGSSVLRTSSEPLVVVDGVLMTPSSNPNSNTFSMVNMSDVESISVLKSPQATALYGSRAANGVILIKTKSYGWYRPYYRRSYQYKSTNVPKREYSVVREFYAQEHAFVSESEKRDNFNSTVLWQHTLLTDSKGKAEIEFKNNDAVSAFRVTAEGFTADGQLGRTEKNYFTTMPVSIDAKIPDYLGYGDRLLLPVRVTNDSPDTITGVLSFNLPSSVELLERADQKVSLLPGLSSTFYYTLIPRGFQGKYPISLSFSNESYKDQMVDTLDIQPIGYPMRKSLSGRQMYNEFEFSMFDVEENSIRARVSLYPNLLADLFTGVESIIREPYGCFEQVSSSTFPNILALQFIKTSGLRDRKLEAKALKYIEKGYKKLQSFEIDGGGFEWFGRPKAHEGLSAYGLLEFYEMQKVYDGVDPALIERTRDWLLSRRDGNGGFKVGRGKYGFSYASNDVTNAYIVYVLSATGYKDILPEYNHSRDEAMNSGDLYRMALLAHSAYDLEQMDDYDLLVGRFLSELKAMALEKLESDHSIVRSYGENLRTEVLAFWTLVMLKSDQPDMVMVERLVKEILGRRRYGRFGATQATTLSLMALTSYAQYLNSGSTTGNVDISVNGSQVEQLAYSKDEFRTVQSSNLSTHLKTGMKQEIGLQFTETDEAVAYSIDVEWYAKTPPSSYESQVAIKTALSADSLQVNETVQLSIELSNKTDKGLPMTIASVGIPAGLSLQAWQLKEMQEKEAFDFYEIINGSLVLYYRELGPQESKTIYFDLKAELTGDFQGKASAAYLYYNDEDKDWKPGLKVSVVKGTQ